MTLVPDNYEELVLNAVRMYWDTLTAQGSKQESSDADRGQRSRVTGGKQMNGFCHLIQEVLRHNGVPDTSVFFEGRKDTTIPGFFRPTKSWDLLVVHQDELVAALEFKSIAGSFGNNFNNRTEEAIGMAVDLWTGYRESLFGVNAPKPWLGWMMLLEDCPKSTRLSETFQEKHFILDDIFRKTSYADRFGLMLNRLVLERHYDSATLLLSPRDMEADRAYSEPHDGLRVKAFLASLAGHVRSVIEGR